MPRSWGTTPLVLRGFQQVQPRSHYPELSRLAKVICSSVEEAGLESKAASPCHPITVYVVGLDGRFLVEATCSSNLTLETSLLIVACRMGERGDRWEGRFKKNKIKVILAYSSKFRKYKRVRSENKSSHPCPLCYLATVILPGFLIYSSKTVYAYFNLDRHGIYIFTFSYLTLLHLDFILTT